MRSTAVLTVAVVVFAACAVVALGASGDTYVYSGNKRVLVYDGLQEWPTGSSSCYEGGEVKINRQQTWMEFTGTTFLRWGYARREKPGQWAVYSVEAGRKLEGTTKQRSSARWDVFRGDRLVGHTKGPDGREASAAFLVFCLG